MCWPRCVSIPTCHDPHPSETPTSAMLTGGIGWGHNIKYRMGVNMLDLTKVIYRRLPDVRFPFLIMHDPEDGERSAALESEGSWAQAWPE